MDEAGRAAVAENASWCALVCGGGRFGPHGGALAVALAHGAKPLGPLRVWVR